MDPSVAGCCWFLTWGKKEFDLCSGFGMCSFTSDCSLHLISDFLFENMFPRQPFRQALTMLSILLIGNPF